MSPITFSKYQGIGNDFILIDLFRENLTCNLSQLAIQLCDRHFGIGADGVLALSPSESSQAKMDIFNADGSIPEMCGNGIRCVANYLFDEGRLDGEEFEIETQSGNKAISIDKNRNVTVDMGEVKLLSNNIHLEPYIENISGIGVSAGNPHLVIFVDDLADYELATFGPKLEHCSAFPEGTNVHFVQLSGFHKLIIKTWERGAGATLACGTGACACTFAANLLGLTDRKVETSLPGGSLYIEITPSNHALMSGPAELSFRGQFEYPFK